MAPAQAPKALERVGVSPIGCTFIPRISLFIVLPWFLLTVVTVLWSVGVLLVWGSLSKTGLAIMRAGVARSTPVCLSPPLVTLPGAIWGTGWAATLPCPGQGGHQFGNLLPQFCGVLLRVSGHGSPSPYLVPNLSFSLSPCVWQPLTENKKSQGCCRDT